MIRLLAFAAATAALATPAQASDFGCRNLAAEIHCNEGACEVSREGEFTPTALTRTGNRIEFCAYESCFSGRIATALHRDGVDFLYARVRHTAPGSKGTSPLFVLYDRASKTAQLRWGGFANAMDCGAGANG